ncbi:hypothetical protein LO872_002670 [Vibrio fluvialis]|nr:hypothetical protein [Vibrio fluvialis]
MNLAYIAFKETKLSVKFRFDERAERIRRDLMVFSTLAIAASFVKPVTSGSYEVNLIVMKGTIENPILLHIFIGIICLYFAVWFIIYCARLTLEIYENTDTQFTMKLASITADELLKKHLPVSVQSSFICNGFNNGEYYSRWEIPKSSTIITDEFITEVSSSEGFKVNERSSMVEICYTFTPSFEDLKYLRIHIDKCNRAKREAMFFTVLPLVYAFISLLFLSIHVYGLWKGSCL